MGYLVQSLQFDSWTTSLDLTFKYFCDVIIKIVSKYTKFIKDTCLKQSCSDIRYQVTDDFLYSQNKDDVIWDFPLSKVQAVLQQFKFIVGKYPNF